VVGAAWATFISLTAVNAYRTWFLWWRYRLWPFDWRFLFVLALMIAILLITPWIPLTGKPLLDLPLRAMIVAALFIPAAYALGLLKEVEEMVRRIVR
jgi:O-antigen/teichoic acid export membrane protein